MDFSQLNLGPINITGILVSVICGLVIGFERQWNGKPAGIRTSILICLSAYTFVRIGAYVQPDAGSVRIVGQMVTGVGFLGAGVIIAREGLVMGVTSAAVIWILAAIGSLTGMLEYVAALSIAFTTLFVLQGISLMERLIKRLKSGVHKDNQEQ